MLFTLGAMAEEGNTNPSIIPVRGKYIKRFGYQKVGGKTKMHPGLDIEADQGASVMATADGQVKNIAVKGKENTLVIDHGEGIETRYEMLGEMTVAKGQTVKKGDVVGSFSKSNKAVLHYEVRLNGQPIDPMNYILN